MRISEDNTPKIGRKDTTIFSNRAHFIEKLTPLRQKIIVCRRKKGQNDGKKFGFYRFWLTKWRLFRQNGGKFPNYNL